MSLCVRYSDSVCGRFTELWRAVHQMEGEEETPYWDLSLAKLSDKIADLSAEKRADFRVTYETLLHLSRIHNTEASERYKTAKLAVFELIEAIPVQIDQIRAAKSLPASWFSTNKAVNEENQKQDLATAMQTAPLDKTAKVKPGAKENNKKLKTAEEARKILDDCKEEAIQAIKQSICEHLTNDIDPLYVDYNVVFRRLEDTFLSDLVDKISRKIGAESRLVSSNKVLLSIGLRLKGTLSKEQDFDIKDVDPQSLRELKTVLTEMSFLGPKFIFVLLKVYDVSGRLVSAPGICLFEYLGRESELKVVQESGPFIPDLEEKLENGFYEDGAAIWIGNVGAFPQYQESYFNEHGVKMDKLWTEHLETAKALSSIGNVYVEADKVSFFSYSPILHSLTVGECVVGGEVRKAFELVHKFFVFEKVQKPRRLFVGGEFSDEKVLFLINCVGYFAKVTLVGRFGLLYAMWKLGVANNCLSNRQKTLFGRLQESVKSIDYWVQVTVLAGGSAEDLCLPGEGQSVLKFHDAELNPKLQNMAITSEMSILLSPDGLLYITLPNDENSELEAPLPHLIVDYSNATLQPLIDDFAVYENTLL